MEDTASIELRRRADWQASTERGMGYLHQGAFAQAIELLKQGDLADAATRSALSEARCQEAQRLMQLAAGRRHWKFFSRSAAMTRKCWRSAAARAPNI